MDALRIYVPDGDEPVRRRLEPEPVPITYVLIEQETPEGTHTDQICVWRNEEAERCRWCPECTYTPTSSGIGTCYQRRTGILSPRLAPSSLASGRG
jgi:hypothetical protein